MIEIALQNMLQLGDTTGVASLKSNHYFHQQGRPTIFLKRQRDIDYLINLKYDFDRLDFNQCIQFPHACFAVAVPKGATICGQPIKGFLVTFGDQAFWSKLYGDITLRYTRSTPMLKITFISNDGGEVVTSFHLDDLHILLSANSPKEYKVKMIGRADSPITDLLDCDYAEQFFYLKLTIAMTLYAQAKPQDLDTGFPTTLKIAHLPKGLNKTHYRSQVLTVSEPSINQHCHSTFVPRYLRWLSHEKYYRGKYAHYKRGTRWTIVDAHVRGNQITPQTLTASV